MTRGKRGVKLCDEINNDNENCSRRQCCTQKVFHSPPAGSWGHTPPCPLSWTTTTRSRRRPLSSGPPVYLRPGTQARPRSGLRSHTLRTPRRCAGRLGFPADLHKGNQNR